MPDPRIFPIDAETPLEAVVVGAVSTLVLAENGNRTGADFGNLSSPSEAISFGLGQAAVNGQGKVMTVYGSTFHMGTNNLFKGDIYAICPSGGMDMSVSEEVEE